MSTMCGYVLDTNGAAISNAEVLLLEAGDGAKTVDRTHSDVAGHFSLTEQKNGSYQLVVQSPGFSPLRRTVHIQAITAPDRCSRPIKVQMGVFGSCSSSWSAENE